MSLLPQSQFLDYALLFCNLPHRECMIVGSAHVVELLVEFAENRCKGWFIHSFFEGIMQRLDNVASEPFGAGNAIRRD
jgi:hypothetical protein